MPYIFAIERPDYSDLASGRVFYSRAGHPAFPVRLASEIFQRCLALRQRDGAGGRVVLYDPCCGAGYLLSLLGYLHRAQIQTLIGSDIDEQAVRLAERNLGLLRTDGLKRRMAEISDLQRLYGKESHREALQSCFVLLEQVRQMEEQYPLSVSLFQADALDGPVLRERLGETQVDLIVTDVPYGLHSAWQGSADGDPAGSHAGAHAWALLEAVRGLLGPGGLVAIAADKEQKVAHERYQRVERFQVGKRRVTILRPV